MKCTKKERGTIGTALYIAEQINNQIVKQLGYNVELNVYPDGNEDGEKITMTLDSAIAEARKILDDAKIEHIDFSEVYKDVAHEAISLLKQCVNYEGKPMTTAVSGELGDRIREFIRRCGE